MAIYQERTFGDVWVCNSDGYVGQVCLVSMIPEAQPKACLSVCSARIVCISAVPGTRLVNSKQGSTNNNNNNSNRKLQSIHEAISNSNKKIKSSKHSPSNLKHKKSFPSESDDDDIGHGAESIIAFDSSDDDDGDIGGHFMGMFSWILFCYSFSVLVFYLFIFSDADVLCYFPFSTEIRNIFMLISMEIWTSVLQNPSLYKVVYFYYSKFILLKMFVNFSGGSSVFGGRMSPDGSSLGTVESMEGERDSSDDNNYNNSSEDDDRDHTDSSRTIGSALSRGNNGFTVKGSLNDLLGSDLEEQETMWLGTEDGK